MQNTPPRTYSGDLADPPRALAALIEQPRWVCWRWQPGKTGGWTKPPFCCDDPTRHALNNEPRTWGTRNAAVKMVLAGKASGVGFVLTESAIAAVDIDKCRDPDTGVIDTWALEILSRAPGAYVEITVSGAGLRVIGTAEGLPTHRRFGVAGREGAGVEVYRRATRYVTVSGLQQGKCAELTNIDAVIDGIVAQYDNGTAAKNGNGHGATNGFDDIDALIRHGAPEGRRSGEFAKVVWSLAGQGLTADEIEVELQQHPTGIMAKYAMRLREEIDRCYSKWQKHQPTARTTGGDWPEPKSLPEGLLAPVGPFRLEYLPKAIAPWVGDISDRLQCPPDYVAVAAMTALGSVIGRRIGIKPQAQTDWIEVPNLWGCFIGQPGMLKNPAMMEALRPLHRLEKDAQKQNELNRKAYEAWDGRLQARASGQNLAREGAAQGGEEQENRRQPGSRRAAERTSGGALPHQ